MAWVGLVRYIIYPFFYQSLTPPEQVEAIPHLTREHCH